MTSTYIKFQKHTDTLLASNPDYFHQIFDTYKQSVERHISLKEWDLVEQLEDWGESFFLGILAGGDPSPVLEDLRERWIDLMAEVREIRCGGAVDLRPSRYESGEWLYESGT